MEKYTLYKECVDALNNLLNDLNNNQITQDYSTIFYYRFFSDQNHVKSEILDLVSNNNISPLHHTLEIVWLNYNGLTSKTIRSERGSIEKDVLENNLKNLKKVIEDEIGRHEKEILELDKNAFIKNLLFAVEILQGNSHYYSTDENSRNDYIRDLLEFKGYVAKDQSRHGRSGKGTGTGEVDIIVCNTDIAGKIIIEGLNLSDSQSTNKTSIEQHFKKLLTCYDTTGNKNNVLLSYVTSDNFPALVLDYKQIIEDYDFEYKAINVIVEKKDLPPTISIIKSTHNRNGTEVNVYHILVQMMK